MGENPESPDGPSPSASQPIPTLERVKPVSASASQPIPTLERVAPVSPSSSQPIPTLERIAPVAAPVTSLTSVDDFAAPWPEPSNLSASSESHFAIPPVDHAELSLVSQSATSPVPDPFASAAEDPFAPVAAGSAGDVMSDFLLHEPQAPPPPTAPPLVATPEEAVPGFTLHSEARVADKPKDTGPDLSAVTVYGTPKKVENARAAAIARRRAFLSAALRLVVFAVLFEVVVFTFGPHLPGGFGEFFAELKVSHSRALGL